MMLKAETGLILLIPQRRKPIKRICGLPTDCRNPVWSLR